MGDRLYAERRLQSKMEIPDYQLKEVTFNEGGCEDSR